MKNIKKRINIFPKPLLSFLKENGTIHTFKPGQTIYYKGHLPYGLFFLVEGTINKVKEKGKISKVNAPTFIESTSFMTVSAYTETAIAVSVCTVNYLSYQGYNEIIKMNPDFPRQINQDLKKIDRVSF